MAMIGNTCCNCDRLNLAPNARLEAARQAFKMRRFRYGCTSFPDLRANQPVAGQTSRQPLPYETTP